MKMLFIFSILFLFLSAALSGLIPRVVDDTFESHVIEATRVSHSAVDQTNLENAIRIWEQYKDCDHAYFDLSPENLVRSKSDEWYISFVDKALKEDQKDYERLGELRYFAKHSFNGQDMRCGIYSNGCEHQPTCETIVGYTVRRNRDLPLKEAMDLARKIYHSQKKIVNIGKAFRRVHDNMGTMAIHVGLRADDIIKDFSPTSDGRFDFMCSVFKQAFDTGLSIGLAIVGDQSKITGLQSTTIGEGLKWINTMIEAIHMMESQQSGVAASGMSAPQYGKGSCRGLISVGKAPDEAFSRGRDLKTKISQYSAEYRHRMAEFIDEMMQGKVHDKESPRSMLHSLMLVGDWSTENGHLDPAAGNAEKKAQAEFQRLMVMGVLGNMKCYTKCTSRSNENGDLCTRKDLGSLFGARTCFSDGYACQAQCWTSIEGHNNHEIPLIGAENLQKYGITLESIVRNSHEQYLLDHQSPAQQLNQQAAQQDELYSLPTCRSTQIMMGDVDDKITNNKKPNNRRLPCTCGDWRSNETAPFMQQIGLGSGQSDMANRDSWQAMERICGENLRELPPLNRFLSYCELGIRFPFKGGWKIDGWRFYNLHSAKSNTVDPRCATIKRLTLDMNEGKANAWFCQKSEDAKKVFDSELSFQGTSKGLTRNHRQKCAQFNKQYTYDTMVDW